MKILQLLTLSLLFCFAVFNQSAIVIAKHSNFKEPSDLRISLTKGADDSKSQDLSITTASLLPATNNETIYSHTLFSSGGSGTKTWIVISGDFPVGLALNKDNGVISGIVRFIGTFVFKVRLMDGIGAKVDKTFTLQVVAVKNSVTVEGDSRTVGYPVAANQTYPVKLQALLGPTWRVRNVAANGQTTDNMLADAVTQVDAFRDITLKRDVVIIWAGINDINDKNQTGQFIYNNIISYAKDRKAKGFEMWVCTEIQGVSSTEREITRLNFNRLIKANYLPADRLVDLNALSAFARRNNLIYYQADALHLTEAANQILANTFFTLLSQPNR